MATSKGFCKIHEDECNQRIPAVTVQILSYAKDEGPVPLCKQCWDEYCNTESAQAHYLSGCAYVAGER